jgi:polyhydroxyalkanoate synthesis regulator protein
MSRTVIGLRRFGEDHAEIAKAQMEFVVIDNETGEDVTRVPLA